MADGVSITPGTGVTVASDDVAGFQYQRVKLDFGGDGASIPVTTATPLPVDIVGGVSLGTVQLDSVSLAALENITVAIDSTSLTALETTSIAAIVPGTGATNLGKAEDAVHASGDTGVMALAVRADSAAATAANGDYHPLLVDSSGRLHVTGGTAGTQYDEGNTDAVITGTAILWEDASDTLRSVSAAKPLPISLATLPALVAGTAAIGKLAANTGVDIGNVGVLSLVPGVGATNLGKAEDSVHTSGDTGVMMLAVRSDSGTPLAANADYIPLMTDATGNLRVWVGNSLSTTLLAGAAAIGTVGVTTVPADPFGVNADAAATAGSTGSIQAKLRLMTTQLDAIKSAVEVQAASFKHFSEEYTSSQSDPGNTLWTPTSTNKICITSMRITTGGTTAGTVTAWIGASGDTSYTAGTDKTVFKGEFAPSSTTRPGAILTFPVPFVGGASEILRIITSAAMTVYVQVEGYEVA